MELWITIKSIESVQQTGTTAGIVRPCIMASWEQKKKVEKKEKKIARDMKWIADEEAGGGSEMCLQVVEASEGLRKQAGAAAAVERYTEQTSSASDGFRVVHGVPWWWLFSCQIDCLKPAEP